MKINNQGKGKEKANSKIYRGSASIAYVLYLGLTCLEFPQFTNLELFTFQGQGITFTLPIF